MRAARRAVHVALLGCIVCLGWSSGQTFAAVRIHLVDGRALDVLSYRLEGGVLFAQIGQDESLGFPSYRVARVERLEPSATPAETQPLSARPEALAAPVPIPAMSTAVASANAAAQAGSTEQPAGIGTLIKRAAERHHVDPDLLAAVIAVESGYRPHALSPRGAQGLMQLMPATARELAVNDPFNAEQNIEAGARYLRQLLDQHGDSYVSALAAYNAGMGRVARYNGIPPYRETVRYIERVLKRYASPEDTAAALPDLRK